MDVMIHMRQRDIALDPGTDGALPVLLVNAYGYYEKIGFAKCAGTALNPSMDTFVLVDPPTAQSVEGLIDRIERVPEVAKAMGPDKGIRDFVDITILPLRKSGPHISSKGTASAKRARD